MIPKKLEEGDTIAVIAPSNSVQEDDKQYLEKTEKLFNSKGINVKYGKNIYSNTLGYGATPDEKIEDINIAFKDKNIKAIFCVKGGENSNSLFEYLDYELIKNNPKIICGYSDITSLTNIITAKTGLVTFSGTNFKTIATDETDYSYKEAIKRFVYGSLELGVEGEEYKTLKEGIAEGQLIGGNLSLTRGLVSGKYSIDFTDKILFLEELGFETMPSLASNFLYYMKQNGVFDKIKGL